MPSTAILSLVVPLVVILVAKFTEGAWITVLAVPAILLVFRLVRRHYARAARRIRPGGPIDLSDTRPPIVVVPTAATRGAPQIRSHASARTA